MNKQPVKPHSRRGHYRRIGTRRVYIEPAMVRPKPKPPEPPKLWEPGKFTKVDPLKDLELEWE